MFANLINPSEINPMLEAPGDCYQSGHSPEGECIGNGYSPKKPPAG